MATKKNTGAKPVGRPSKFTQELANNICERIANGESLRKICQDKGMPNKATVFRWQNDNSDFRDQYARACDERHDLHAEQIIEIADDPQTGIDAVSVSHAKLRVDARKWYLSKLAPKKYGEKVTQEITGAGGAPVQVATMTSKEYEERARRLLDEV